MSYKNAPEVNTGGEMGQILDHLLCAKLPEIRMEDAREALRLHNRLRSLLKKALAWGEDLDPDHEDPSPLPLIRQIRAELNGK
jgi:hypothetical protein